MLEWKQYLTKEHNSQEQPPQVENRKKNDFENFGKIHRKKPVLKSLF